MECDKPVAISDEDIAKFVCKYPGEILFLFEDKFPNPANLPIVFVHEGAPTDLPPGSTHYILHDNRVYHLDQWFSLPELANIHLKPELDRLRTSFDVQCFSDPFEIVITVSHLHPQHQLARTRALRRAAAKARFLCTSEGLLDIYLHKEHIVIQLKPLVGLLALMKKNRYISFQCEQTTAEGIMTGLGLPIGFSDRMLQQYRWEINEVLKDEPLLLSVPDRLSDAKWDLIKQRFTSQRWPTKAQDAINGILYVLRTGCPWPQLPQQYGLWETVYNHFWEWSEDSKLLEALDELMKRERHAQWLDGLKEYPNLSMTGHCREKLLRKAGISLPNNPR